MLRTVRFCASAVLAAGLLAACGRGTPVTTGTATPQPFNPGVSKQFAIPTKGSDPIGITIGSGTDGSGADASLWFTENASSKVGQIDNAGDISDSFTPTLKAGPTGITAGPNNYIWFAENLAGKIGQIDTVTQNSFIEFTLPATGAHPQGLALGSDGNVWVTDPGTNSIWRIEQDGDATQYHLTGNAQPTGIVGGPDGALWFTETGTNRIGRLPTSGSPLTEYKIPTPNSGANAIVAATDNGMWFTETKAVKIGRVAVTGQVTSEYKLTGAKTPNQLVQGIDGNFYFTDTAGNQIGQFQTTTQNVRLFPIKTGTAKPTGITLGPDNQIYFTEPGLNDIGQFKYFCC